MPWVRFTADFDWYPPERNGRYCIAYKSGMELLVTTPCAVAAETAGKAVYGKDHKARPVVEETGEPAPSGALSHEAGASTGR